MGHPRLGGRRHAGRRARGLGASPAWWITLLTFGAFILKTAFFILIFMLMRWTVPRFRYDQVMDLGWKVMLPSALGAVVVTAATILALDSAGVQEGLVYGLVLMGWSMWGCCWLLSC